MAKRVIIVHGWGGSPEEAIHKWLKTELEKRRFKVVSPGMPNANEPVIDKWVSHLDKAVGRLDKDTYFVGHSIGCQTIMRYLEKQNTICGGTVFIAGWFNLDNMESEEEERIAKPWIENIINFQSVRKNSNKITVFISSNEPYGYIKENAKIFREKLGAKVIIEKDKGHFTEDDGVSEVPEVLNEILEMSS